MVCNRIRMQITRSPVQLLRAKKNLCLLYFEFIFLGISSHLIITPVCSQEKVQHFLVYPCSHLSVCVRACSVILLCPILHDPTQPTSPLCPQDFPGKNTGAGCYLLSGHLPNPGIESASPALACRFFTSGPPRKSP